MSNTTTTTSTRGTESNQQTILPIAEKLGPKLIHKILLTEPNQIQYLTMSGGNLDFHNNNNSTPTFEEFISLIDNSFKNDNNAHHSHHHHQTQTENQVQQQVEWTMRRAFRDNIIDTSSSSSSSSLSSPPTAATISDNFIEIIQKLILELHNNVRSLVPNRKDLHYKYLHDDDIIKITSTTTTKVSPSSPSSLLLLLLVEFIPLLINVGSALEYLESELRYETTKKWINIAKTIVSEKKNQQQQQQRQRHQYQLQEEKEEETHHKDNERKAADNNNGSSAVAVSATCTTSTAASATCSSTSSTSTTSNNNKKSEEESNNVMEEEEEEEEEELLLLLNLKKFIIHSIMYLSYKCDLCENDKQNFYLTNVYIPQILSNKKLYEQYFFIKQFGGCSLSLSSTTTVAPLTRKWIHSLIQEQEQKEQEQEQHTDKMISSNIIEERKKLIKIGWVEDILFRSCYKSSIEIPEIFIYDIDTIQHIRYITTIISIGSALVLHSCNAIKIKYTKDIIIQDGVLVNNNNNNNNNNDHDDNSCSLSDKQRRIENCKSILVKTLMSNRIPGRKQNEYESDVIDAVFMLTKELLLISSSSTKTTTSKTTAATATTTTTNAKIDDNENDNYETLLKGQIINVLSGNDPVVKVLDKRIKNIFVDLVCWNDNNNNDNNGDDRNNENDTNIPSQIKNGINNNRHHGHHENTTVSAKVQVVDDERYKLFERHVKKKLSSDKIIINNTGLSFFISDLISICYQSNKIINLAWEIYGNDLLLMEL